MRSGTENVPGIAAFAEAVRVGKASFKDRYRMICELREYLMQRLSDISELSITAPERYVPHIINITLPDIKSETMLHYLSSLGIFVSSGSACSSNGNHGSPALIAYGRSQKEADSSIRISLSYRNTREDVDGLVEGLKSGLARLSRMR